MKSILLFLISFKLLWSVSFYGETRVLWNIPVTVSVWAGQVDRAREAVEKCFLKIKESAGRLNYYDPRSEVSKINRNSGIRPVKVSEETFHLIERAIEISRLVDGAFDITVRPLYALWDFRRKRVPTSREIAEAKERVGYDLVVLDRRRRTVFLKKRGMEIDLGGILKGFLADRCVEVLKEMKVSGGMVAVGGDLRVFGSRPGRGVWRIGIKDPRGSGVIAVLELREGAVSTSGDYERFFLKGGKRYHHIIDPRTGYPAKGVWSATVVAGEGVLADALSTALFVLGVRRSAEVLRSLATGFVLVERGGRIRTGGKLKLIIPAP